MSNNIEKILETARKELGTKENPPNSNKVKYNTDYYGSAVSGSAYPWCCVFQWWIFRAAGLSHLFYGGKKTASCTTYMNWAKAEANKGNGSWLTDVRKIPPGAVVLFNWNNGTPRATAQHIGICYKPWTGSALPCIEGNTGSTSNDNGGNVMERNRQESYILGAYMPNYAASASEMPQASATPPTLRKGSEGQDVRNLQGLLNKSMNLHLDIDGKFGPLTEAAVKNFQLAKKLAIDGVVGPATWAELLKTPASPAPSPTPPVAESPAAPPVRPTLRRGDKGEIVKELQALLNKNGAKLDIDGSFGPLTEAAVREYQNRKNLLIDGAVGPQTWGSLLNATVTVTTTPQTGAGNEAKIYTFLREQGLSAFAVAGLMGNLYAESGLYSVMLERKYQTSLGFTSEQYVAAVDGGKYANFVRDSAGFGLAQWTYWSRKEALLNYAKAMGASIGDLNMQLAFLWHELSVSYKGVLEALKASKSVREASDIIMLQYERPADQSESARSKRAAYGQGYYDKYARAS